jgi:hypothetical protein
MMRAASAVALALALAACTAQARLETLIVLAIAEGKAAHAVQKFDHARQEDFRQQYQKANTLDDVRRVDVDVAAHNIKRDAALEVLGQLSKVLAEVYSQKTPLAKLLILVEEARGVLAAFGVDTTFEK